MSGSTAVGLAQQKIPTPADPSPVSMQTKLVFITGDTCFVAVLKIIRQTTEAEMLVFGVFLTTCSMLNYPINRHRSGFVYMQL